MAEIPKKKTKGRQRIPMARIQDKIKRTVAFSKRRTGLFKKASDLCTLCGSEIAILAFSETGKSFAFGHPDSDSVIQRYLRRSSSISSASAPDVYGSGGKFWWEGDVDNMELEELERFADSLRSLKKNVADSATTVDEVEIWLTEGNDSVKQGGIRDIMGW